MICNIIDVMEMAGCDDTLWHSINSEAEDVLSSLIIKDDRLKLNVINNYYYSIFFLCKIILKHL